MEPIKIYEKLKHPSKILNTQKPMIGTLQNAYRQDIPKHTL